MSPTRQGDACIPATLRRPPAPRPVIDREVLRDIPLGYLTSLLKGEAHSQEHPVGGALDPGRAPVEDVGIDHRGADVLVAEQLLDGADVVALLQQVGGEGVPQPVRILLMNPPVFEFATVTIPSSLPRSI